MKNKTITFLLLFLLFGLNLIIYPQQINWAKSTGGNESDWGKSLDIDNQGNVYVTGSFMSTNVDFDPGPGVAKYSAIGYFDIFIAKYDALGNFLWVNCIGGNDGYESGENITIDDAGNVYVTGYISSSSVDFDPSPNSVAILNLKGSQDIFIAKYNTNGDYLWAYNIGGDDGIDRGNSLTLDSENNIYLAGTFKGKSIDFDPSPTKTQSLSSIGDKDIFIAKFSTSGTLIKPYRIAATNCNSSVSKILFDGINSLYITGNFWGNSLNFDPTSSSKFLSSDSVDGYIAKYNLDVKLIWVKQIGGSRNEYSNSLVIDNQSNLYITGFFSSTDLKIKEGSDAIDSLINKGGDDIFLAKYDSSSKRLWIKNMGGNKDDNAYSMSIDPNNNLYITGSTMSSDANFDPSGNNPLFSSSGMEDIFLAKYDTSGNCNWSGIIGGSNTDIPKCIKIGKNSINSQNNLYLTGYYNGANIDFDIDLGIKPLNTNGIEDIFIAKYCTFDNNSGVTNLTQGFVKPGQSISIDIQMKNFGYNSLSNVDIGWQLDGIIKGNKHVTLNLPYDSISQKIHLGNDILGEGTHYLKAWTENPNGQSDTYKNNDTLRTTILCKNEYVFTIGAEGDFKTFTEAVSMLKNGIDDAISFNILPGIYMEHFEIPEIPGSSINNQITFQSINDDYSEVVLSYQPVSNNDNYTIRLNGADFINFKSMTFESKGISYRKVIDISNESIFDNFFNNKIITSADIIQETDQNLLINKILVLAHSLFGHNNNFLQFSNNLFENGWDGLNIQGSYQQGLIITNNTFKNQFGGSIFILGLDSPIISNNNILLHHGLCGINSIYSRYIKVLNNKIYSPEGSVNVAIKIENCDADAAKPNLILNNMVSINAANKSCYGIMLNTASYFNIYYNSLNIFGLNTDSRTFLIDNDPENINIKNNIFSNTAGGYAFTSPDQSDITFDYNDYYSTGTYLIDWGDTKYKKFLSWQSDLDPLNAQSLNTKPWFYSIEDLHAAATELYQAGILINNFDKDIDMQTRHDPPCIGADEFEPCSSPINIEFDSSQHIERDYNGSFSINVTTNSNDTINFTWFDSEGRIVEKDSSLSVDSLTKNTIYIIDAQSGSCYDEDTVYIHVRCIQQAVSKVLTKKSDLIDHGCPGMNYANNTNSGWLIKPDGVRNIYLCFLEFDLASGDTLKIYEGMDPVGGILKATYFKGNEPDSKLMLGNKVFISFTSDSSETGEGFVVSYSDGPELTDCLLNDINYIRIPASLLTIYPNPASDFVVLNFNSASNGESVIKIYNLLNRLVTVKKLNAVIGMNEVNIDISTLDKGLYIVEVITGQNKSVGKLMIE